MKSKAHSKYCSYYKLINRFLGIEPSRAILTDSLKRSGSKKRVFHYSETVCTNSNNQIWSNCEMTMVLHKKQWNLVERFVVSLNYRKNVSYFPCHIYTLKLATLWGRLPLKVGNVCAFVDKKSWKLNKNPHNTCKFARINKSRQDQIINYILKARVFRKQHAA